MGRLDELRLMTKAARLYYEQDANQSAIADQLNLSQATVSRLLRRAKREDLVRITVSPPLGTYLDLEEKIKQTYGLKEVVVVDSGVNENQLLRDLGAAAAFYVESTIKTDDVVGISSWSATLLAMVDAMHGLPKVVSADVVQILGGVGDPSAEGHASHLNQRLAKFLHGRAVFLPAPGIVGSPEVRSLHLKDPFVRDAMGLFGKITLALIGIGSVAPSSLLASSGNVFSTAELNFLKSRGAVGDVCLRFFDSSGKALITDLDDRVIGITLSQLRRVARTVAVAGGERKIAAIRGALKGRWINVLVTDQHTATALLEKETAQAGPSLNRRMRVVGSR